MGYNRKLRRNKKNKKGCISASGLYKVAVQYREQGSRKTIIFGPMTGDEASKLDRKYHVENVLSPQFGVPAEEFISWRTLPAEDCEDIVLRGRDYTVQHGRVNVEEGRDPVTGELVSIHGKNFFGK